MFPSPLNEKVKDNAEGGITGRTDHVRIFGSMGGSEGRGALFSNILI